MKASNLIEKKFKPANHLVSNYYTRKMEIMELLDLNVDCLLNLCPYLDAESIVAFSETCKLLKSIAEDFFQFKKSYTCCIGTMENEATAAKTLRKTGKYLTKIDLMFELEYKSSNKLFELITGSLGRNLIELSILGEICCLPLELLDPILLQLEVLTIQNLCREECCPVKINLPNLCPNLRQLRVRGQVVFAPNHIKSFQQLKHLDVDFTTEQYPGSVFSANSQLKKLNLLNRYTIHDIDINNLTFALVNLEELQLDVKLIKKPVEDLPRLNQFLHLHTLALYTIPSILFNDISKTLETITRLRNIELQSDLTRSDAQFSSIQDSLVRIATTLTELKSFVTVNIDWLEETIKEFVGSASNLIYFDFWSSGYNSIVEPNFIRELAATRKNVKTEPLNLKMYAMDYHLKQVSAVK